MKLQQSACSSKPDKKSRPVPTRTGVGARPAHYQDLLEQKEPVSWIEVHAENFMGGGGQPLATLEALADLYPLSIHGVGLSLGSAGPMDKTHLTRLKTLTDRFNPALVSEHLSWSRSGGACLNDLLPIPYTAQSLNTFSDNVDQMQNILGRKVLIENPSAYLKPVPGDMSELEFLTELARRTRCGILADVNNVYVSAWNLGFDPETWINTVPADLVDEIHLAGFTRDKGQGVELLVDTHGTPVSDYVWKLYEQLIARIGPRPVLIEWDTDIPDFKVLIHEAQKADQVLARHSVKETAHAAV